jgi:hypothetical protein
MGFFSMLRISDAVAVGMSFATAVCWGFNFIVSITFPLLLTSFTPQGAFGWYAGWCFVLFCKSTFLRRCMGRAHIGSLVLIVMFVPETKGVTLEELDQVFGISTRHHAAYGLRQLGYIGRRYVLHQDVRPEPLYDDEKPFTRGGGDVEQMSPSASHDSATRRTV